MPEKLVSEPATVNVLPLPTDSVPLFVKLPAVVKLAPPERPRLLEAAMVARFERALWPPPSMKLALEPFRMILAASVTISPPALPSSSISSVPDTL